MKAFNDKKIQEILDGIHSEPVPGNDPEMHVYQTLYEALSNPAPDFSLPEDFADSVVLKIEKKKNIKNYFALCVGFFGLLAVFGASFGLLFYFYPTFIAGIKSILEFKVLIAFLVFLVFAIQLLDWLLIKRRPLTDRSSLI